MALDLTGKNVLITGAASGMGFEMAKALLAHGATVIVAARKGSKLDNAMADLSALGDAHSVELDVTDEESAAQAAAWFEGHFDHLDLLINNAGIGDRAPGLNELSPGHQFFEIPTSAVRLILETNIIGCFIVSKAFVPLMVKQGRGMVVYTSTSDTTMVKPGQIPYGPSKAGAEAMMKIMAQELADKGIDVNIICPGGFTDTPLAGEGVKEFFLSHDMPILQPDVMNRIALFLASPMSDGLTGEKLVGKEFDEWLVERGIELDD